jgi:hypothetical protein
MVFFQHKKLVVSTNRRRDALIWTFFLVVMISWYYLHIDFIWSSGRAILKDSNRRCICYISNFIYLPG